MHVKLRIMSVVTGMFSIPSLFQCIDMHAMCDGQRDCWDGTDETECHFTDTIKHIMRDSTVYPPPAMVNFNVTFLTDSVKTTPLPDNLQSCPETHFKCDTDGYCLPVFLRCNGVKDCPRHEDESRCNTFTCPGFYQCRASRVCLHVKHVCDSIYHCSQHDDELFCGMDVPQQCTCYGLACTCNKAFDGQRHSQLRYLDAADSGVTQTDLSSNIMLVYLSLARCGIPSMNNFTFPNLHTLDVRQNNIEKISAKHLVSMPFLKQLFLATNPVQSLFHHQNDSHQRSFQMLRLLDISGIKVELFNDDVVSYFPNLRTLNLSDCDVREVQKGVFRNMTKLRVLDVRGCPMTHISGNFLSALSELRFISADNYKLCCPAMLPRDFNLKWCKAPSSEISSCADLLRSRMYCVLLSIVASSALLGNLATFISRFVIFRTKAGSGFTTFLINLSISDFLMGVYLAMIGLADRAYRNSYLWEDMTWRHSIACSVAGFLSLLSSEMSAMMICLITLDRFIVVRFPFSSVRFGQWSSVMACSLVWIIGVIIAAVPFTTSWEFYSQTGICIPLPITRNDLSGQKYSFGVIIILNFVLFMIIAAGQAFVFLSIRANSLVIVDSSRKSQDLRIARGLASIVVSDFLCWFPIGLLGLLASHGIRVSGEVNVAMAILVLPLNSALNPFLYNLNLLTQRRRKGRENKILTLLTAQTESGTEIEDGTRNRQFWLLQTNPPKLIVQINMYHVFVLRWLKCFNAGQNLKLCRQIKHASMTMQLTQSWDLLISYLVGMANDLYVRLSSQHPHQRIHFEVVEWSLVATKYKYSTLQVVGNNPALLCALPSLIPFV